MTKEEQNTEPTLAELRKIASTLKSDLTIRDADLKKKQEERAAVAKKFRAIIGKIETRVANGEV